MSPQSPIETTENCRYCLMCRHVAPVEQVTYRESHTPHGWALLIASVRRGLLAWDADTVDALYHAPDGGNSRAHCVTDQPLPDAIAATRAEIAALALAPPAAYAVRDALEQWQNPYEPVLPEPSTGRGEVALFVGDEAHFLQPATLEAALTLLGALDIAPLLIGRGRSSGFLASSLGFPETARALARATLAELAASGARRLLVLSPGDAHTLRRLWPDRLDLSWPEEVELLEVVELLAEQFTSGTLPLGRGPAGTGAYAYIDPTHAVRRPERHAAPRLLLAATLDGEARELFWRQERGHPVGSTALQFTHPDVARALTRARLADGVATGAERLFTDCPATLTHLQAERTGGPPVSGLYEHLAAHLVDPSPPSPLP